jgi:hypothetical protein
MINWFVRQIQCFPYHITSKTVIEKYGNLLRVKITVNTFCINVMIHLADTIPQPYCISTEYIRMNNFIACRILRVDHIKHIALLW